MHLVEIAIVNALLESFATHLRDETRAVIHGDGQRLRAAHASASCRDIQCVAQRATEMLSRRFGIGFVSALQDSLRADVDPRARGHLSEHHQAALNQIIEVLLRGPVRNEIAVGDQHARRIEMCAHDAHRFATLHQQRLIGRERFETRDDRVEALPIARGLTAAAIHDKILWALGNFGIEVVHEHAHRRFRGPCRAHALVAARRTNHSRRRVSRRIHG